MSFENKINELKIKLPKAADPVGSYVATKISGKLLFISGQISIDESGELIKGKVGKDLDTKAGYNYCYPILRFLIFMNKNFG